MIDLISAGKFIALILRHKPETIGITLDEHGWANVDELIAGIQKTMPEFNMDIWRRKTGVRMRTLFPR